MTAEIGILNRHGVALAADSAVTVSIRGKQKVLNSANKLFNLIKGFPVGLMIYGNGDFNGIPWEIIIDDFRKKHTDLNEYDDLYDYASEFMNSLNDRRFYSEDSYIQVTYSNLYEYITIIIEETKKQLSELYPNREISQDEARMCFIEKIKVRNSYLEGLEYVEKFDKGDVDLIINDKKNQELVSTCLINNVGFDMTNEVIEEANKINALLQCKNIYLNYTGVVISGFGKNDFFPRLYEFKVYGIINDKLKYIKVKDIKISASELTGGKVAEIVPFAQQEMVQTILNGMDPDLSIMIVDNLEVLLTTIVESASEIFNCDNCEAINDNIDKLKKNAFDNIVAMMTFINGKSKEVYTDPVLSMVASLPKDELAAMAETLVNLTSFKRKITMEAETVGGPIDVAIISKAEGFIWMKRKLYFSKELNQNYYIGKNM